MRNHSRSNLLLEQDRLWSDHFWYTRQVVVSAVNKNPCLNKDIEELLSNQDDLGKNFAAQVNNHSAGVKLATVLREHINIAIKIVTTAIAGGDIDQLYKMWQNNARDVSKVYSKFNRRN